MLGQLLAFTLLWTVFSPAGEGPVFAAIEAEKAEFAVVEEMAEENPFFRNVSVKGKEGQYKVTGEARPSTGVFYYTVEDGHNELIKETKVNTEGQYPDWKPFEINVAVDKDKLPENGILMLNLYERSEGQMIHFHHLVLEEFFPSDNKDNEL